MFKKHQEWERGVPFLIRVCLCPFPSPHQGCPVFLLHLLNILGISPSPLSLLLLPRSVFVSLLLRVVFSSWLGFWPLCPAPVLPPSLPPLYRWAKLWQLSSRSPFYYPHLMISFPCSVPTSGFPLPKRSVLSHLLCLVYRILPSERRRSLWTLEKECLVSKLLTGCEALNQVTFLCFTFLIYEIGFIIVLISKGDYFIIIII